MSRLDDIKDQFTSQMRQTWERFQDSSLYHNLSDRYEDLSPGGQKAVRYGSVSALLLILFYFPFANYQLASENISHFEEKRELIRELLRVAREANEAPELLPAPPITVIKSQVENDFRSMGLIAKQIVSVQEMTGQSQLIPTALTAGALDVQLAKLNLRQVVEVAYKLSLQGAAVKLKDMSLSANAEDPRYIDAHFKLHALKVPEKRLEPPPETESKPKRGKKSNSDE